MRCITEKFVQIEDYVYEPMHLVDLGIVRIGICELLRTGFGEKNEWKYVTKSRTTAQKDVFQEVVSDAFRVFRKCLPKEYARKPRDPFADAHHYKSVECRTVGSRFLPALLNMPRFTKLIEARMGQNFWNLVIFCRLICHFSCRPLTDVSCTFQSTAGRHFVCPLFMILASQFCYNHCRLF